MQKMNIKISEHFTELRDGEIGMQHEMQHEIKKNLVNTGSLKSGQQDLNLRPHGPQPCALPSYAIPRNK